jgi:hypothetical protein
MLSQPYELPHLSDDFREHVRQFMLDEVIWACRHNKVYASKYLTPRGVEHYPELLQHALANGSPDSLCDSLHASSLWSTAAPKHSIDTFAWDEFNKYYMRALCRIAQDNPQHALIVVRGRQSRSHRGSSDARMNQTRTPAAFLQQLRVQPAINPFGANSGLTLTLQEIGTLSLKLSESSKGTESFLWPARRWYEVRVAQTLLSVLCQCVQWLWAQRPPAANNKLRFLRDVIPRRGN